MATQTNSPKAASHVHHREPNWSIGTKKGRLLRIHCGELNDMNDMHKDVCIGNQYRVFLDASGITVKPCTVGSFLVDF